MENITRLVIRALCIVFAVIGIAATVIIVGMCFLALVSGGGMM